MTLWDQVGADFKMYQALEPSLKNYRHFIYDVLNQGIDQQTAQ